MITLVKTVMTIKSNNEMREMEYKKLMEEEEEEAENDDDEEQEE